VEAPGRRAPASSQMVWPLAVAQALVTFVCCPPVLSSRTTRPHRAASETLLLLLLWVLANPQTCPSTSSAWRWCRSKSLALLCQRHLSRGRRLSGSSCVGYVLRAMRLLLLLPQPIQLPRTKDTADLLLPLLVCISVVRKTVLRLDLRRLLAATTTALTMLAMVTWPTLLRGL
jgi:hypothetical protein